MDNNYKKRYEEAAIFINKVKKTRNWILSHGNMIDLSSFDDDVPCEICSTVINAKKKMSRHDYIKFMKKNKVNDIWSCSVCCQRLLNS